MAHITINDLPLDVELDRQAMVTIVGGSRAGRANGLQHSAALHSTLLGGSTKVVDYPPGCVRGDATAPAKN